MKFLCSTSCVQQIRLKTNGSWGKTKSADSNNKDNNDDYDVYDDSELMPSK